MWLGAKKTGCPPLEGAAPKTCPENPWKIRLNGFCKLVKLEDDGSDCSAG